VKTEFDVIIIGAGIIGASIAFELSKRGHRTLNIDKQPAAGYGSTANSCAIIRTHYSTFQGTALAWESLHYWRDWPEFLGIEDESGFAQFLETGIVAVRRDEREFDRVCEFHESLGIPFELWDAGELKQKMPFLDCRAYWPPKRPSGKGFAEPSGNLVPGALAIEVGGYVNDPVLAAHNLQLAVEARGGRFLFNSEVVAVLTKVGRADGVRLADGTVIHAGALVNAAGPHSGIINELAGIGGAMKLRTRPLRHEVHFVPAPQDPDANPFPVVLSDNDVAGYCRPEIGGKVLVGSQDPECDPAEWVDDPDDFNREVTTEQWNAQVYRMAQRVPGLPIPNHPMGVVDLYDVSDDWIPIYDRSDLPGFYLAIGTSGNQFKNAPMVGILMAELIEVCQSGRDHDADPVQVSGKHTGSVLDLGFYSRLREINRDSSFTVMG
jgi:sarcosine oxidase subunit beta